MPIRSCCILIVVALSLAAAEERVITDDAGRTIIVPVATPDHLRNPWPEAWEESFRTRRSAFIAQYQGKAGVNTALENEKQGYPPTILAFCAGDRDAAIAALQAEDAMASNHKHTAGIDLYWCFTLKGQVRKYFFLGQYLDPDYRERMQRGATAWTATDPRPNTELVLYTDSADEEVRAYAREAMAAMWRSPDQLRAMADEAEAEGHPNKKRFAVFLRGFADNVSDTPPTDPAGWMAWWGGLCKGDWIVYEEYDRRVNLRPHPQFGIGTGPVGTDWSPKTRGGVVDWRNTDNLRAMREGSIYLFAEETGSELVRRVFKERLRRTATLFLTVGNGEWDSPAYLSHTASAYLNLYDFAKDEEVRLLAKAILDFVSTSIALKYRDGSFGGPNCRDYGTTSAESGPARMMHFFVGADDEVTPPENDIAHYATSAYRPPAAVVALARKKIDLPVEIFASHPHYQNFLPGNAEAPKYHETTYIAHSYQMGTLLEGGQYDVNGGKILVANADGGTDFVIPSSQKKGNICTNRDHNDRIAQFRNLQLFLHRPRKGTATFNVLVPKSAACEVVDGIAFVKMHRTWMAVHGINASLAGLDKGRAGRFKKVHDGTVLAGDADGEGLAGLAIELGEAESHGDYQAFKQAVRTTSALDLAELDAGKVVYTGVHGHSVGLQWADGRPTVWRDGVEHDLAEHRALWRPAAGGDGPVRLGWRDGVLRVVAGGHRFIGTLDLDEGTYSFTNE